MHRLPASKVPSGQVQGDVDEARNMIDKCKLEHSRLAAFADHEGFDLGSDP